MVNLGSLPENVILITEDVGGFYPTIPYEAGLQALEEALENRNHKQISTDKLIKMAQFVLKNNFFKSNNVFQQISGTAVGTKFALPYACIFMDQILTKYLTSQSHLPILWFRYIDSIFFVWTHGERRKNFMAPFYGWGSTASRLVPLRGGSWLFTTKFPDISGTHFIDVRRMKG